VWGHSQGGHSSLWAGTLAKKIAPELDLLGVGAAAPAAELAPIVSRQWNQTIGWVIGAYALVSMEDAYPLATPAFPPVELSPEVRAAPITLGVPVGPAPSAPGSATESVQPQ
jgi:hypothetical protein